MPRLSVGHRIAPLMVDTEKVRAVGDGDAKVPAEFDLQETRFRQKDAPAETGLRFTYRYGEGWKFVRIAPPARVPVEGKPNEIGVWVVGDGTPSSLRMRYRDRNGRTFQPELGKLSFREWRFLTARMDDPNVGGWGGVGDPSKIAYPVEINTFILVDGTRKPTRGEVQLAGFCLLYRDRR